jgi:hypothetical protein
MCCYDPIKQTINQSIKQSNDANLAFDCCVLWILPQILTLAYQVKNDSQSINQINQSIERPTKITVVCMKNQSTNQWNDQLRLL